MDKTSGSMANMRKPRVLVIHNSYRQAGGEDAVMRAEVDLLRRHGHEVSIYLRSNEEIEEESVASKCRIAAAGCWNSRTFRQVTRLIERERPEIAHCHNLFPLISPSAYHACRASGIPIVQTLHNYRAMCPSATCFRDGKVCHHCGTLHLQGISHGCYRSSRLQTAAVAVMNLAHRVIRANQSVDAYIVLSEFCRKRWIDAGLPAAELQVKPNFVAAVDDAQNLRERHGLFVGRLSPEKGIAELLNCWVRLPHVPLVVVGDGPLMSECRKIVKENQASHIHLLGQLGPADVSVQMRRAAFLVFPSLWDEPCPVTLIEAAACGLPAVASRLGGIPEIVLDGRTGLLFDPFNRSELVLRIEWARHHARELEHMGNFARAHFQETFSPDKNYAMLSSIYHSVLSRAAKVRKQFSSLRTLASAPMQG